MDPVMEQFLAQDRNVRLIYKDLPILGPASTLGSKALLAAQKQNGYEKLREAVMKLPSDTTQAMIQKEAERLGLDWPRLLRDMQDPAVQQRLDANLKLARDLGIQGTPALVIGDQLIPGAVGLDDLKRTVDSVRQVSSAAGR
jgi:protein-disulfide isomerase